VVIAHDYGGAVSLRAHLLHGVAYRSLTPVDVVALAPWGSEFFRLAAENSPVFVRLPAALHEALVRAYISGAAHRPLPSAALDMLTGPWLGAEGQAAFYRQIARADQRHTDEVEPLYRNLAPCTLIVWGSRGQLDPGGSRPPAGRHDPLRGPAPDPGGRPPDSARCARSADRNAATVAAQPSLTGRDAGERAKPAATAEPRITTWARRW
jgi:pimeloyl-ACP methyl ester carboxylesterase